MASFIEKLIVFISIALIISPTEQEPKYEMKVELWDYNDYDFELQTVHHSSFRNKPNFLEKNPIQNLNKYLEMFQPDCLTHLINYRGSNFLPFQFPVVISRYDVVWALYFGTRVVPTNSTLKIDSVLSSRKRFFEFEKTPTPIQLPWCRRLFPEMQCWGDFPYPSLLSSTSPWTCEAHLYLDPPSVSEDPLFYSWDSYYQMHRLEVPAPFRYFWKGPANREVINKPDLELRLLSNMKLVLVSRPKYQVLVSSSLDNDLGLVSPWKDSILRLPAMPWLLETLTRQEMLLFRIQPLNQTVTDVILLCKNCEPFQLYAPLPLGHPLPVSNLQLESGIQSINKFRTRSPVARVLSRDASTLLDENRKGETHRQFHSWVANESTTLLQWRISISLMLNVVVSRNVSLCYLNLDTKNGPCTVRGHRINLLYDVGLMMTLAGRSDFYHARIHGPGLKFLSCGRPPNKSLGFHYLTSAFDFGSWAGITSILIFSSFLTAYIISRDKAPVKPCIEETMLHRWLPTWLQDYGWSSFLGFLKTLLEQGNPFRERTLQIPTLRFILLPFFLMAIILSNGYRNDNVTKMTLPLEPIPYHYLKQLLADRFQIFTMATTIWRFNLKEMHSIFANSSFFSVFESVSQKLSEEELKERGGHRIDFLLNSLVYLYAKGETTHLAFLAGYNGSEYSNSTQTLLNVTRLHPDWWEVVNEEGNFTLLEGFRKSGCNNTDRREGKGNDRRNGNKTAFILSEIEAYPVYYQMLRDNFQNVYLGKESWLGLDLGVMCLRWIHQPFLDQMNALLDSSGVYDFLYNKLLVKFRTRLKSGYAGKLRKEPRAANLEGNIAVVFTILPVGLGLGIGLFLWEKPWTGQGFRKLSGRLKRKVRNVTRSLEDATGRLWRKRGK